MTYSAPPRRPADGSDRPFGEPTPARARTAERPPRAYSAERHLRHSGPQPALDPVAQPLRFPDLDDPATMARRAWWLVALNLLVPGSPQALAGNRTLGRLGLAATLAGWGLVLVAVVVLVTARENAVTFFTNAIVLTVVQVLIVAFLALWVVLMIDTLRIARLLRVPVRARLAVPAAATAVLVGLVALGGYGVTAAGAIRQSVDAVFGGSAAGLAAPIDGRYNVLILGGDAGAGRDGMRPDSIGVVSIDATTGKTVLIGLPRELEDVPFPADSPMHALFPNGFKHCKASACMLNSIYTEVSVFHPDLYPDARQDGSLPGYEATKDAVEAITGLTIQYTVAVNMNGFAKLVDALGGVTINVTERLPIGGQAEDLSDVKSWIEPGVQKMNGNTALWYARSRHSTSDYDRMDRQHQLEEAILRQFAPATVVGKFQKIANAGAQIVSTDVPQSAIGAFVALALKTKGLGTDAVTQLELTPDNGVDPDGADWKYVRQLVAKAVGAPKASATPTP